MYTNLWIPTETDRLLPDRIEAELREDTEVYIKLSRGAKANFSCLLSLLCLLSKRFGKAALIYLTTSRHCFSPRLVCCICSPNILCGITGLLQDGPKLCNLFFPATFSQFNQTSIRFFFQFSFNFIAPNNNSSYLKVVCIDILIFVLFWGFLEKFQRPGILL